MKRLTLPAGIFLAVFFSVLQYPTYGQSQASGLELFDEAGRALQLYSESDSLLSFCVRPLYTGFSIDSVEETNLHLRQLRATRALRSSSLVELLPVALRQQYNTHHPYGRNDGSMIPAKGYQGQLSFGFLFRKGIISLQLRPEIVYAHNDPFPGFAPDQSDEVWRSYYNTILNVIDAPSRFGSRSYAKLFPGQSAFRINYRKLSLGLSTENLWWGPGIRNALIMSDNAPGFPHLTFNSSQPLTSGIGSFEWQLVSGKLTGSGFFPDTSRMINGDPLYRPKQEDADRYLNGIVFTWRPKWTKTLFVGFSRVYYQYVSDVSPTLDGYLPVLGKLFKGSLKNDDARKRDQMISFFFRWALPKEKAEFYGEFGRNDHAQNAQDFLVEPEHSRAYIIGFSKWFEGKKKDVQLFGEITNLQKPSTLLLRAQESWYAHYQVRHGYTNYGQVIGAGIGPGGASQTIGLQWGPGLERLGATFERVVHNNDFYYNAFAPYQEWQRHWVDLSLNVDKSWLRKNMLYNAGISLVHSINYQWYDQSATNLSARLSVAYLF